MSRLLLAPKRRSGNITRNQSCRYSLHLLWLKTSQALIKFQHCAPVSLLAPRQVDSFLYAVHITLRINFTEPYAYQPNHSFDLVRFAKESCNSLCLPV